MSCEDTTALLFDRLKGLLAADDERRLEAHLETCADCRAEAEAMALLWTTLGSDTAQLDAEVPHERMRARFHAALAAYESRSGILDRLFAPWAGRPALRAALAAALVVVGVLVGRALPSPRDEDIAALRAEVRTVGLALLDHQSASERLLGVAWAQRAGDEPRAVNALLERLEYDPNENVRLAAVEALRPQLDRPEVVDGLAAALERQDAPLLQVTLANALLAGGGTEGVAAVRRLLERKELDPTVRDYLDDTLQSAGAAAPARPRI
jgi:Putative zinc-finger/HEAT repeats